MKKLQSISLFGGIISYSLFTFFCLRSASEGLEQPANYFFSLYSFIAIVVFLSTAWIISLKEG
jgi:hypothetical protein